MHFGKRHIDRVDNSAVERKSRPGFVAGRKFEGKKAEDAGVVVFEAEIEEEIVTKCGFEAVVPGLRFWVLGRPIHIWFFVGALILAH